jgi:hypothetical protein
MAESDGPTRTVWIYVNANKSVGDADHMDQGSLHFLCDQSTQRIDRPSRFQRWRRPDQAGERIGRPRKEFGDLSIRGPRQGARTSTAATPEHGHAIRQPVIEGAIQRFP